MKHECCELFRIIPKEEIKKVFKGAAAAELDYTFLAFEEIYKSVLNFVPKGKTIIDLGCAYAPQAYYFTEYSKYIGVDVFVPDIHFTTANMTLYQMSAQQFCKKVIDEKWDLDNCFAICSYVPDVIARKCVRETFPNCLAYYP